MSDEVVFAVFEPGEATLLTTRSQASLLTENPILALALSNIFPYLLLIDNFLEVVTWTNDDPYQNFLVVVVYSVLVLYWGMLKLWILPLLIAIVFSSVVWTTSLVIYDSKFGERPTIDEVLHTLHNITVRFELLLRPAKHVTFSKKNYAKMILGAVLATPVHVAFIKMVLLPSGYTWLLGVFFLTYHSPWLFSIRRLLWRSVYVRMMAYYLTGLDIRLARNDGFLRKLGHSTLSRVHTPSGTDVEELVRTLPDSDKVQLVNDFTILKKVIVSPTQLRQTVRFDILENERRWLGLGWSKYLLPNERASFCYSTLMLSSPDPHAEEPFVFPVFENDLYTYLWQWMDDAWKIDMEYNKSRYKTGWVYYDSNWTTPVYEDGFSKFTRLRKWTRRAILLIDKQNEVHDA